MDDRSPAPFMIAQRCAGRHVDQGSRCCTAADPCEEGEGDCDGDDDCGAGLVCGDNNCKQFGAFFHPKDDCCVKTGEPPAEETIYGMEGRLICMICMMTICVQSGDLGSPGQYHPQGRRPGPDHK